MSRDLMRLAFLERQGWGNASILPLTGDASFRSYYRIARGDETRILMDAPPEKPEEDTRPFIAIGKHLASIGLSVPEIYAADVPKGFLLLEDFGDATYPCLLDSGADPMPLFTAATDALIHLHQSPKAVEIDLPHVGPNKWIDRASLLVDWYLPEEKRDAACSTAFTAAWQEIFAGLPSPRLSFTHRDYHAPNFMWLPERPSPKTCGILDFQDGEMGPAAYDLVSLLQDPRRDTPPHIVSAMMARYASSLPVDDNFRAWFNVLSAQRACRIMGVFVRLSLRDGKHHYRAHLPRLEAYLRHALTHAELAPLKAWAEKYVPDVVLSHAKDLKVSASQR